MEPRRPDDPLNAFTDQEILVPGATAGPLAGLSLAVKDLYDVAGCVTRAGNPDWARTHEAATVSAPAVQTLLDAGATVVAKTHTDELAWSLLGENAHYGTPTNPRAPDRVPGGSSSGSVAAVAGGLVDLALGSDTGGSVRIPASNCGVYGIRTTHGRLSLEGVVPLAPTFDTVGWFAREADLLARVGDVYFGAAREIQLPDRLVIARDAFALVDDAVRAALAPALDRARELTGRVTDTELRPGGLEPWADAWRVLQAREVWAAHGAWVERTRPSFGPGIAERFAGAATLTEDDQRSADAVRALARERMTALCPPGAVVCLPAAPSVAPLRGSSADDLERYRSRAMQLTCPAGLAGVPQISIPGGEVDGAPIGLSFLGAAGADAALLRLAVAHAGAA